MMTPVVEMLGVRDALWLLVTDIDGDDDGT